MNVRDFGKLIVAKGFKKLPKVQKAAQSGHTGKGAHSLGAEKGGKIRVEHFATAFKIQIGAAS